MNEINITLSGQMCNIKNVTISPAKTITGVINTEQNIGGCIQLPASIGIDAPEYDGQTEITPDAYNEYQLETKNKIIREDITVFKIPTYETSNASGTTFIIAS